MNKMGLNENVGNVKDTNNIVSKGKTFVKSVALAGLLANGVNTSNSGELVNDLVIDTGVKYANVDFLSVKGDYLLSGYTDETGKVTIPKTNLVNALQQNAFNYTDIGLNDVILNVSVNTDPGGAGANLNTDLLSDYGTLSSAGRVRDLNNSVINNTTTLVEKLVYGEWYGNIWEFAGDFWYYNNRAMDMTLSSDAKQLTDYVNKSISRVVSGLDQTYTLTDSNTDGIVNRTDIFNGVQEKLKQIMLDTGYSEGIKYGDYDNMHLVERDLKRNNNFVNHVFRNESGVIIARLDSITEGAFVEYSDRSDFANKYDVYPDDDLYLTDGIIVYFRERFSDNTLGKVNTLKVVGTNIYRNDKVISTINTDGTIVESVGATSGNGTTTGTGTTTNTGNTGGTTTDTGNTGSTGSTGGGSETSIDTTTGIDLLLESIDTSNATQDDFLLYVNQLIDGVAYTSEMMSIHQLLNQLKTDFILAKDNQTLYYNSIDNYTRNLLDSSFTTEQKQQVINNILSDSNATSNILTLDKTYEDIPNDSEISTSIAMLQNTQNQLPQIKENWRLQYLHYEQEYKQKEADYNNYQAFRNDYIKVLDSYNNIYNQLIAIGTLPNLNVNIGLLVSTYGANYTINELNNKYNSFTNPYNTTYKPDTLTKGLPTSGYIDLIQVPGEKITYKMTYGSNLSFPAALQFNFNGVVQPAIQINNTTHRDAILAYHKRKTEYNYTLNLLNLLKPEEASKNYLDSVALANSVKYNEMQTQGVNYYLSVKSQYETALANYNSVLNAEARFETIKGRLTIYGMKDASVNNLRNSIYAKQSELLILIENQLNLVASTNNNQTGNKYGIPNTTSKKYINSPNFIKKFINGGKFNSKSYIEYPFTSYAIFNRTNNKLDYPALVWVEYKTNPNDTYLYSTERVEVINEAHQQKMYEQLQNSVKVRIDLLNKNLTKANLIEYYSNVQIASNNGWWGDGYRDDLKGISKNALNARIDFFAGALFEYNLKNDINFRNNFIAEYTRQANIGIAEQELILGRPLTQAEKNNITNEAIRGVKDGIIRATRDYLMQYIDLVGNLTTLTYDDISNTVTNIWDKITHPISTIATFNNGINKTLNKLEHLGAYEYSFGSSYIGTNASFVVGVPGSKIINIGKLDNILIKIDKTIDGLITNLLNSNIKRLGAGYVIKFNTLNSKIVASFTKDNQIEVFKRISLMDNKTLTFNLDNPDLFLTSYNDGKYPLLLEADDFGKRIVLKNVNGKIVDGNGYPIDIPVVDFIVTETNGQDWIVFGENHSYLSNGKNINYAGEFKFDSTGNITGFTNRSGHYLPDSSDLVGLQKLKNAYYNRFGIQFNINFITQYNK